jgi:hypothetical protein
MSAFTKSGRSNVLEITEMTGRFRPEAGAQLQVLRQTQQHPLCAAKAQVFLVKSTRVCFRFLSQRFTLGDELLVQKAANF